MKRKILLSILFSLISIFIFSISANAININAVVDPNTSHIEQLFSDETSGKVAIDKTVEYNQNEYINNLTYGISDFSITLSAVGQDYIKSTLEESTTHPDIMFVVDVSGSMKDTMTGSNTNRIQSTVQALNATIDALMAQDPETRWGVISFGNNYYTASQRQVGTRRIGFFNQAYNAPAGLYLPIHKYTSTTSTYFSYSNNRISSNVLTDENSTRHNSTSYTVNSDGTFTQAGLYGAYQAFTQVTDTTNRFPVVVLITDGVPTIADSDIWPVDNYPGTSDTAYNSTQFNDRHLMGHGYVRDTTVEYFGYTIKSAIHLKQELTNLYGHQAAYITIGPGVDYLIGKMVLNPSQEHLAEAANNTTTNSQSGDCTPQELKEWLETHSTEEEYLTLTDLSDFSIASDFSLAEYTAAMTEMTTKIFEQHFSPFDEGYLTITDTLDDMVIKNTPQVYFYGQILNPTSINTTHTEFNYSYGIHVQIVGNDLIWLIPTEVVPLFKTNEHDNAQPIRLIYTVGLESINSTDNYYTNASANGQFNISGLNPYYENLTDIIINKEENRTNTQSYVNQITVNGTHIEIELGNNGLISFMPIPQDCSYILDYGLALQHSGLIEEDIETSFIGVVKDKNNYSTNTELIGDFGAITINPESNNVIYTPNTLNFVDKDTYFLVYNINQVYDLPANLLTYLQVNYIPATFIYYEDNFSPIIYNNAIGATDTYGTWKELTSNESNPIYQNADLVNNINSNIYGYDQAYENCMVYSNGTTHYVDVNETMGPNWPTINFDFTGTGFDIISTTDNLSGVLLITIKDDTGKIEHKYVVDNFYGCVYEEDEYVPYPDIANCLYQIPVIKCSNLDYKHHYVTIMPAFTSIFNHYSVDNDGIKYYRLYFDAVRIYSPSITEDSLNSYILDNESQPHFEEIKNVLIKNQDFTESYSEGMIFIDGKGEIESAQLMENIAANPNNEIYLTENQMVAFQLQSEICPLQTAIGLKVASGNNVTTAKIYTDMVEQTIELNTSTEMYYALDLNWQEINGIWQSDIIIIKNTSDSILSLTNIKTTGTSINIKANNKMRSYAIARTQPKEEEQIKELSYFYKIILQIIKFFKFLFNLL